MTNPFDVFIGRVLSSEGGYVNDPADPGGETRFGISKRSYPDVDIKGLSREAAVEIYRRDFWARVHADELPPATAFQALDFAVNSGIETAVRKLQEAAGVADDGHWGPVTVAAIKAMHPTKLTLRFIARRLRFMRKLSTWSRFSGGWSERIAADMDYAADDLMGV